MRTLTVRFAATEVEIIDRQHAEFVSRIVKFVDAVACDQGNDEVVSTLEFLETYAQTHFATEEALMKEVWAPTAELNAREHREFVRRLLSARKELEDHGPSPALVTTLRRDMYRWLLRHIRDVDAALRPAVTGAPATISQRIAVRQARPRANRPA